MHAHTYIYTHTHSLKQTNKQKIKKIHMMYIHYKNVLHTNK